ncbi:HEAT repeat domain-containing protein [Porifericola rhodea]|uniref:HEAT repeat domain-containing protein n=1 Tax=Porifericola rhodea TaxID=930972 RepID=UPI00266528CC|nr:HEAT repeat domain-containing protein [Porifericola rhodea]WKN30832.1 HEAT repeat domain-containing protein [Porifericola rhodea]
MKHTTRLASSWTIKGLLSSASLALCLSACQQEAVDLRTKTIGADEAAQMAQKIEGLVTPELADGLNIKIWGVDSIVADPISIDIDDQGRLYYSRTNRQKNSEFDIRRHQDWEIASIKLQSVEDKREFLHTTLSPENSQKNEWLKDLNGDGSHDWKDMTVEKEHIYRLEDKDGDGLADFSQLMVEDFHEETTDVAGAIMAHNNELFVGVAPDLWRLTDNNGDGITDEKTSISHGYGIHIGFGAHGMSGLEIGPDGKIYWGIGDIGFNGTGPDGQEWKYPNRGVIVRANPDGSDFEVFAMGVRNTHEFTFDEYGNLISQDNDGDHPGESERLVYIVNGSDTGWRINWQFGKYKDPDNNAYKVWMDEGLYKPRFEGQAAYITPCIQNFVNGPTGLVYNPGTALGPKWKNNFFVAEFVGNPARSGIHSFKLKPKGATFELAETEKVMGGVLATGIDFGPDGAMYFADWVDGWGTKDFGRIWKLDDESTANSAERKETERLLKEDFTKHEDEHLGEILKSPDMRVRQKAQFELAKRGEDGAEVFQQAITQTDHQLARVHGIWGLAQLARQDQNYAQPIITLLLDNDPEIRAQAAKWLGDIRHLPAAQSLLPLLNDEYPRARFFAAEALGRIAYTDAIQPLIQLLESNNNEDAYIRHAASLALARIGNVDAVAQLYSHPSNAVRLGAVLALRRMGDPAITNFLNDQDEYILTEAARAINDDFSIEAALPALGNLLRQQRFNSEPLLRRAINANLRLGTEEAMQNLIDYAQSEAAPSEMRAEAIAALSTWAKPSVLDRVTGRYRGEIERDINEVRVKASQALVSLAAHRETHIRLKAVNAIGRLGIEDGSNQLMALLKNDKAAEVRVEALQALAAMESDRIDQAIEQALTDNEKQVRIAGLDLMREMDISDDLKVVLLTEVIDKRTTEEKQAALLTLGNVAPEASQQAFEKLLNSMKNGNLPYEIHLELAEAIDSTHSDELKSQYEQIQASMSPDEQMASYRAALFGGDPRKGQTLVYRHSTAQCMKCHAIGDYGSNVAPRLNGVADRLSREEILEALINPSAKIAPGYGVVTLEMQDGKTVSGTYMGETEEQLMMKIGSQSDTTIMKNQIAKKNLAPSSMPDMKNFLTKKEIRDIVSLLATLKGDHM